MDFWNQLLLLCVLLHWHSGASFASRIVDRASIKESALNLSAQYDYIIVGGGTSGLTVANRLTEDTASKIVMLAHDF